MKAIGFFCAVFLSMLAVFLIATGEVQRWFSGESEQPTRIVSRNSTPRSESDENLFECDYWNAEQGRRDFSISAELLPSGLEEGAKLEQVQEIRMRKGHIEIPLYDSKLLAPRDGDADGEPANLWIEFSSALYGREGGLTQERGGGIKALFESGKGYTDSGTQFFFDQLQFENEAAGENAKDGKKATESGSFVFRTDQPVSIINDEFLEVFSPSGLRGRLDRAGIDRLEFLPPVYTYLNPRASRLLSGKTGSETPPAEPTSASASGSEERVVVTCAGPLEILFRRVTTVEELAAIENVDERDRLHRRSQATRVIFRDDVLVYDAQVSKATGKRLADHRPPPAESNRFLCQSLILDIDDSASPPVPRQAIAEWKDGRVQTTILRDGKAYTLDGDRLVWTNPVRPDGARQDGEKTSLIAGSEGVLTGLPRLVGPDAELVAERAVMQPAENRLLLEKVRGTFFPKQTNRKEGDDTSPRRRIEALEFEAENVLAVFTEDSEGRKVLSHFIASSESPHGIVLESRTRDKPAEENANPSDGESLLTRCEKLTFDALRGVALLEGRPGHLPRLDRGDSWIESRSIELSLESDPQTAQFSEFVRARIRLADFIDADKLAAKVDEKTTAEDEEKAKVAELVEIHADKLDLIFRKDGSDLARAMMQGTADQPVELATVEKKPLHCSAPTIHWIADSSGTDEDSTIIELLAESPDSWARLSRDRNVVLAKKIRFYQEDWRCELENEVTVEVYEEPVLVAGRKETADQKTQAVAPQLRIVAGDAVVQFREQFKTAPSRDEGSPLARLGAVERLVARATPDRPLEVTADGVEILGEQAVWSSESRELTIAGDKLQEIRVARQAFSGPIFARQVIWQEEKNRLVLQTDVRGELLHAPTDGELSSIAGTPSGEPMLWNFETHRLEVELAADRSGLTRVLALDKVVLFNPQNGILLRGDDLEYLHARRRIRVFSRDGRRQTLQRFPGGIDEIPTAGAASPGAEGGTARPDHIDTIDAEEIIAYLYQGTAGSNPNARTSAGAVSSPQKQMLLVQFRRHVMANFLLPDPSERGAQKARASASPDAERCELIAQQLTLHIDPTADASSPAVLPWAFASGETVGDGKRPRSTVTLHTHHLQARADTVEYRALDSQLILVGSPATLSSQRPDGRVNVPDQRSKVILLSKPNDQIKVRFLSSVPSEEPWPGVPAFLTKP